MDQKPVVNGKKETPFLETSTGQIILMASSAIFTGFCMALGGNLFNKVAGTSKSAAMRDDNVINLPARKVA